MQSPPPALALLTEGRDVSSRNRRHFRHPVTSLAYVRLDHANGGIIRNLSESGIAIQAVGRLHAAQVVHLRFELLKPKVRIDVSGEVMWADSSGQAGLRFVDLPERPQRQLRDWIFTDLLSVATQFGPNRSPIFGSTVESEREDGLLVSAGALPSIKVAEAEALGLSAGASPEMPIRFSWWPADIYPRTLARLVDSMVIGSSVLLFAVIAVETAGTFPSWPVALLMASGLVGVFGAVYYYFFRYLAGTTLGRYLARMAAEDTQWITEQEQDGPRFR
jgi:hypothetical protein